MVKLEEMLGRENVRNTDSVGDGRRNYSFGDENERRSAEQNSKAAFNSQDLRTTSKPADEFCDCSFKVRDRTVIVGTHAGSAFYCCGHPKAPQIACNFFVWKNPAGMKQVDKDNKGSKRNLSDMYNQNAFEGNESTGACSDELPTHPLCQCDLPTTRLTCRRGQNEGKVFYVCPKDKGSQCKYWEWETNVIAGKSREYKRARGDGSNAASGGFAAADGGGHGNRNGNNTCFKCRQEGHWASNCPN
jgi:hypothetical protein